mmetsp:Transcript_92240/g.288662  ORF Transcript_92240/g.288662 Transcript_92240/m.288662 type:complete len:501 (-) Transcript_92240:94-1596(-)
MELSAPSSTSKWLPPSSGPSSTAGCCCESLPPPLPPLLRGGPGERLALAFSSAVAGSRFSALTRTEARPGILACHLSLSSKYFTSVAIWPFSSGWAARPTILTYSPVASPRFGSAWCPALPRKPGSGSLCLCSGCRPAPPRGARASPPRGWPAGIIGRPLSGRPPARGSASAATRPRVGSGITRPAPVASPPAAARPAALALARSSAAAFRALSSSKALLARSTPSSLLALASSNSAPPRPGSSPRSRPLERARARSRAAAVRAAFSSWKSCPARSAGATGAASDCGAGGLLPLVSWRGPRALLAAARSGKASSASLPCCVRAARARSSAAVLRAFSSAKRCASASASALSLGLPTPAPPSLPRPARSDRGVPRRLLSGGSRRPLVPSSLCLRRASSTSVLLLRKLAIFRLIASTSSRDSTSDPLRIQWSPSSHLIVWGSVSSPRHSWSPDLKKQDLPPLATKSMGWPPRALMRESWITISVPSASIHTPANLSASDAMV